jgi:hypothetical protein
MRLILPKMKKFWSPALIMPMSNGLAGLPVLSFVATLSGGSNAGGTTTFSGVNFGTAFSTRFLISVVGFNNVVFSGSTMTATIGGNTATVFFANQATNSAVGIFYVGVSSGTSGTVTVTQSGGSVFTTPVGALYSVDSSLLLSTTPTTASNTATSVTTISTSSFTQTVNGFTILGLSTGGGTSSYVPPTGFVNDTAYTDLFMHLAPVLSTSTGTLTYSWTGSSNASIAAASWR